MICTQTPQKRRKKATQGEILKVDHLMTLQNSFTQLRTIKRKTVCTSSKTTSSLLCLFAWLNQDHLQMCFVRSRAGSQDRTILDTQQSLRGGLEAMLQWGVAGFFHLRRVWIQWLRLRTRAKPTTFTIQSPPGSGQDNASKLIDWCKMTPLETFSFFLNCLLILTLCSWIPSPGNRVWSCFD